MKEHGLYVLKRDFLELVHNLGGIAIIILAISVQYIAASKIIKLMGCIGQFLQAI